MPIQRSAPMKTLRIALTVAVLALTAVACSKNVKPAAPAASTAPAPAAATTPPPAPPAAPQVSPLDDRRAQAVRRFMLFQGVNADQITTVSYGEAHPADSGHDETAWSKNRRA